MDSEHLPRFGGVETPPRYTLLFERKTFLEQH